MAVDGEIDDAGGVVIIVIIRSMRQEGVSGLGAANQPLTSDEVQGTADLIGRWPAPAPGWRDTILS